MTETLFKDLAGLVERITNYLTAGGLFNPDMARHENVSKLLIDCREALAHAVAGPQVTVDKVRGMSSRAYCDYIDQMRRDECLGHEQKLKEGKFGAIELNAHCDAAELLGRHRAFAEIAALLAAPVAPAPPQRDEADRDYLCDQDLHYDVDGKCTACGRPTPPQK